MISMIYTDNLIRNIEQIISNISKDNVNNRMCHILCMIIIIGSYDLDQTLSILLNRIKSIYNNNLLDINVLEFISETFIETIVNERSQIDQKKQQIMIKWIIDNIPISNIIDKVKEIKNNKIEEKKIHKLNRYLLYNIYLKSDSNNKSLIETKYQEEIKQYKLEQDVATTLNKKLNKKLFSDQELQKLTNQVLSNGKLTSNMKMKKSEKDQEKHQNNIIMNNNEKNLHQR